MNSLSNFSDAVKRCVIAIGIISIVAVGIAAQKVEPQSQGKLYGEAGFRGEPINLNVVNADIRDILSYITDQYGINFVIDKSVKEVPVTVKVNEVPWNVALDSVLRSQQLAVQVNGSILRVAESATLAGEQSDAARGGVLGHLLPADPGALVRRLLHVDAAARALDDDERRPAEIPGGLDEARLSAGTVKPSAC